jgi:hypothetical protein
VALVKQIILLELIFFELAVVAVVDITLVYPLGLAALAVVGLEIRMEMLAMELVTLVRVVVALVFLVPRQEAAVLA